MSTAKATRVANTDANERKMQNTKCKIRKGYFYSVLDGVIQGVIICLLSQYFFSIYMVKPVEMNIIVILTLIIISVISFIFLILHKTKEMIRIKLAISIISFLAVIFLDFINLMTLNINVLPLRETSNADGLLIIFFVIPYFVVIVVLRIIALIIRNIIEKQKEKTHIKGCALIFMN